MFSSDVMKKYNEKAGLHATRFVAKIYSQSNLVKHKRSGLICCLASLLDRGMQLVNWLQQRTIVCFIK